MSLKEELGLPGAAYFAYGAEGEIHIADVFGGTWCADRYDEETGDYQEAIELEGKTDDPGDPDKIHDVCLEAALEEV